MFSRPARGRCLNKHGRPEPFLPATKPNPGGLKGRGALGEPGRSRRPAPRARESDALPVTQAEREPSAPSGSRRRGPTTARDRRSLGALARQRRARTPQGAKRPRSVVRKTPCVFRQCGKSKISRLRPEPCGFWHHHERTSLSRTTASRGQRGDGVASSRASGPKAREQTSRAPRAFSRFCLSRSLI